MMRKAPLARVAVVVAVAAGGVLAAAGSASAAIGNCEQGYGGLHTTGYLACYSGSGQYQVRVTCDNENPFGSDYYKYGAWAPVTQTSTAGCSNGDYAYGLYTRFITGI